MLNFKYHYLTNTLSYQKPFQTELWYQLTEEKQFIRFNSQGFILESPNHWINFTVYENRIRVFYKEPAKDIWASEKIIYYRKYLPKQEEIIFTFGSADQVQKVENKWRRKGANH